MGKIQIHCFLLPSEGLEGLESFMPVRFYYVYTNTAFHFYIYGLLQESK